MCKTDDIITCVAGVRKGRGREFECETTREGEGRRGTRSLPPSSRAPRTSLAPSICFSFLFRRLPRAQANHVKKPFT